MSFDSERDGTASLDAALDGILVSVSIGLYARTLSQPAHTRQGKARGRRSPDSSLLPARHTLRVSPRTFKFRVKHSASGMGISSLMDRRGSGEPWSSATERRSLHTDGQEQPDNLPGSVRLERRALDECHT